MLRARTGERGVALLLVMVAVAVLTALAADLAYESRVSLRIAANARDELRATALAKGGVALARVVLSLQQQIDDAVPAASSATPGRGGAPVASIPSIPRPQIWRLLAVGDGLADGLFGGPGAPRAAPAEGGAPAPRGAAFDVEIDDEGRKVNAQLDASVTGALPGNVQALYQLVCDPRWDALFDRDDANGIRVSRHELLVYLRDWVDTNEQVSVLAAGFPPGGCAIVVPPNPFEDGFGDENFPYDRGEDRYRAKNARMDSLAELHLVAGVTDAFMAAFGDALTVYLPRDAKPSVNDPQRIVDNAMFVADLQGQAMLLTSPELRALLQQTFLQQTRGFFSLSPTQFVEMVKGLGISTNAKAESYLTDRSTAYRLRAVGRAGDVAKTLDVVLWSDPPNTPVTTPWRIVHWREE
jgi:general secretion pathway protein K